MGLDYSDSMRELTWGDLLEEIKEKGFAQDEYFEYGGISNNENKTIEESLIWGEGVTGVAVYCMKGTNNEWYVRVDPTYAKGMIIYGSLGKGLLGKFPKFERAMEAVRFITGRVYGHEEEIVADSTSGQEEQGPGEEQTEEENVSSRE